MNNIVLAVLQGVVVMAVAPFFSGLGRVIRAKMHNRRGPSIMQDYRDLAKLFARPESQSEDASFALRIMPPLFFAVAFMLAMGLPLFTAQSPIPVFGDAITIMYSLASPASSSPSAVWIRPTPTPVSAASASCS